jgi:hypothetical protein
MAGQNYCVVEGCLLSLSWCRSVPKRRHIKFSRRGITHKKTYNRKKKIEEGSKERRKIQSRDVTLCRLLKEL